MPGVAYTTGSYTHKEIHFALSHIENSATRARDEIRGVLTHEMVHCFQYNAKGTCPGGLIEGIAGTPNSPSPLLWDLEILTTIFVVRWMTQIGFVLMQDLARHTGKKDVGESGMRAMSRPRTF